jgi:hypothetical protein
MPMSYFMPRTARPPRRPDPLTTEPEPGPAHQPGPAGGDPVLQHLLHLGSVLAKLAVGAARDPLEAEADQVAEHIMRSTEDSCECGGTCGGCASHMDGSDSAGTIRRRPATHSAHGAATVVPDSFVRGLGPGRPMDPGTRAFFEPRFGRDLGGIRIHNGAAAAKAAASIGAAAFTTGEHIAFARHTGPNTDAGRRVLAHELAHVVQQGDGRTAAIQRVGPEDPPLGYFPAERELLERERAEEARKQARHEAWERSHPEQKAKYLKTVSGGSIARDIETTKSQIIEQRMALFGEIGRRQPRPDLFAALKFPRQPSFGTRVEVPAELGRKWALAQQEVVVVETLLAGRQFTPEDAAVARAAFLDFLTTLLPVVEASDRQDLEIYQMYQAFDRPAAPSHQVACPGSCHTPNPPSRPARPAPNPQAPVLSASVAYTSKARSDAEWQQTLDRFRTATTIMDRILLSSVPTDSPAREGFTYAQGLLERQEELQKSHPAAFRIPAVFYPEDSLVDVTDANGKKETIAAGIPWYFYLTHTDTPSDYRYPRGFEWVLQDITSPKRPIVRYPLSGEEIFTREFNHLHVLEPPPALFRKLNNELIFPKGMLYWTYPTGNPGQLRTTEPWSVSKWLGAIGMGIAGLALILASGGLATPGVLTALGVASAGFSIASTLTELQEKAELGILTDEEKYKAILFIAADLASALSAGLGAAAAKATKAATIAGRATRMTVLIQRTAKAASAVDKLLGATVMITVTGDFIQQYQAIQHSNLSPAEREKALQRLALTGMLTGAMMFGGHLAPGGHAEPTPHGAGAHPEPHGARAPRPEGEVITVKGHTDEPATGWSKPKEETEFLDWSRQQEKLKPDNAAHELQLAQKEGKQRSLPNDPEYSAAIDIEGHAWKQRRDGKGWCRFTTKVCYPDLRIGVHGTGERASPMTSTAEVNRTRRELARQPRTVTSEQGRLDWADYTFYANRRLDAISEAIAAGRTPPPPPRTFQSFLAEHPPGSVVRNEIRATRFERKVESVFHEAVAPERIEQVKFQHHISESTAPTTGKGELTRPDVMFPSAEVKGWTAVTDKSRANLVDASPAAAKAQVRADLDEAVSKYAGVRQVRRTGEEVDITRVWLMYDAAQVPARLRGTIQAEVRAFQRQYKDTKLVFEVGFL